jgi:ribonuclease HI
VVLQEPEGRVVDRIAKGIGVATNNVAEYTAAIEGLERAHALGARSILLRSDSKLLIEQLSGRWRVKNPTLIRLHEQVRSLLPTFPGGVAFEHVPRELNREADRLANRGVDEWLAGPGKNYRAPEAAPPLFPQESD